MAWFESPQSQLNNSKERSFYADSDSDISNLPTEDDEYPGGIAPGSNCLSVGSGIVYILDSERNWSPIGG